jgi:hypothetical protein
MASPAPQNRFVGVWRMKQLHGIAIGDPDDERRGHQSGAWFMGRFMGKL